jgi:predicted lipid-binding transport protein (Tim44 family)
VLPIEVTKWPNKSIWRLASSQALTNARATLIKPHNTKFSARKQISMDGKIDLTTLLFLVLAVVVFLKLRSVLGRRTGDETTRYERFKAQRTAEADQSANKDKIVTLPRRDRTEPAAAESKVESVTERQTRMTRFAGGNAALATGLVDIANTDTSFDPTEFMKGARSAYEMIVMAFAEGNRNLLRDLLSPEVYEGFDAAVTDREGRKETIEQSFVGIKSADMVEAEFKGGIAQLTIKFVSELISATRNAAAEVIGGDPKRIKEMTDVWTFARDVSSNNPNWRLVATQAAG